MLLHVHYNLIFKRGRGSGMTGAGPEWVPILGGRLAHRNSPSPRNLHLSPWDTVKIFQKPESCEEQFMQRSERRGEEVSTAPSDASLCLQSWLPLYPPHTPACPGLQGAQAWTHPDWASRSLPCILLRPSLPEQAAHVPPLSRDPRPASAPPPRVSLQTKPRPSVYPCVKWS